MSEPATIGLRSAFETSGVRDVLAELDRALIGLAPVKKRIRETAALLLVEKARKAMGLALETPDAAHVGTGKTTVALRMADLLHRLGYIRKDLAAPRPLAAGDPRPRQEGRHLAQPVDAGVGDRIRLRPPRPRAPDDREPRLRRPGPHPGRGRKGPSDQGPGRRPPDRHRGRRRRCTRDRRSSPRRARTCSSPAPPSSGAASRRSTPATSPRSGPPPTAACAPARHDLAPAPTLPFRPAAVPFDLDGTLVDSAPDIAAAVNELVATDGLAPHPLPAVRGMVGNVLEKLVERALAARGIVLDRDGLRARHAAMAGIYARHLTNLTTLRPGAQATRRFRAPARW